MRSEKVNLAYVKITCPSPAGEIPPDFLLTSLKLFGPPFWNIFREGAGFERFVFNI